MIWLIATMLALVLTPLQAGVPQKNAAHAITSNYGIAGIIIDADSGAPIVGARVSITAEGNSAETTSDDNGRFSFDGLPPGQYTLSANAHGYIYANYDQHGQFSTGIVVGNGLDSEHIVFELPPQGVIYGTITDAQGDAVRHAQVTLFEVDPLSSSQRPRRRGSAETNDLGQYRFAHLNEGRYYVAVHARPWYAEPGFTHPREQQSGQARFPDFQQSNPLLDVVYPVTFFPGVTDPAAANELHVTPGDQEEADIELTAVPSAHVLVSGLPADPPNGVTYPSIRADETAFGTPIGPAPIQEREVSPGVWELDGLPPGPVTLIMQDNRVLGWSGRTIATSVTDDSTIDASGGPSAIVFGHAILPAMPESAQCRVMLTNAQLRETFEAPIRKDGTFTFPPSQPGTYRVALDTDVVNGRPGPRFYVEGISATGAQVAGHTITIVAPGNVELTLKAGFGVGTVSGIAKLAGKPVPGILVLLVPASGQNILDDSRRDQSNSDGSFTLGGVIPDKYVLMAIANGWHLDWTDPATLKPYRNKGQPIQIAPGETLNVTVNVQPLLQH